MKKTIAILLLSLLFFSCGPKRMSCYGKRCVEISVKKGGVKPSKANS